MKKLFALMLAFMLTLSLLTACGSIGINPQNPAGGNNNPSGPKNDPVNNPSTPQGSGYVFNENDEDVIIEFNFEDEEHRQAILAWLKVLLYAEDYYEFVDGEDYDAPYDFDYEEPIWLEDDAG